MAFNGSSESPRRPPHITVNSGSGGNILGDLRSDGSSLSTPNTAGLTRQLLPPHMQRGPPSPSSNLPQPIYSSPVEAQSSEMLLPPSSSRTPRPYQDAPSEAATVTNSAVSSR